MRDMKYAILILLLLVFAAGPLLAAEPQTPGGQTVQFAPGKEKRAVATLGSDGVQRIEIVGGEYYFNPNHLVVSVNKPVELRVKKSSRYVPHNIIVKAPEAGINFKIDMKGDFLPIRFTPTRIGKYPMYCDTSFLWFENHQAKGMEGMIEVVE